MTSIPTQFARWTACTVAANLILASASTGQPVLLTSPATVGPTDTTIVDQSSSAIVPLATADILVQGTTLTISGRHHVSSLVLQGGASLTHPANAVWDYSGSGIDEVFGVELHATSSIVIDASSTINVSERGYPSHAGPGAGSRGTCGAIGATIPSGGGHGGAGGRGGTCFPGGATYDRYDFPYMFGSGGGYVGPGGGAVLLEAQARITVDGTISARGGSGSTGRSGGAGGTIRLTASLIEGTGSLLAYGGNGQSSLYLDPGAGGGGRISLIASSSTYSGSMNAGGGTGSGVHKGAAGTIFTQIAGVRSLLVDNQGLAYELGFPLPGGKTDLVDTVSVDYMRITGGGCVSTPPMKTLHLYVSQDLTIDAGSAIRILGRGYGPNPGPGAGAAVPCGLPGAYSASGGAHAEEALAPCNIQRPAYGSRELPVTMGSEGGSHSAPSSTPVGGYGGGAMEIHVGGTLHNDGKISTSGLSGVAIGGLTGTWGGGAGGSIIVSAANIDGTGTISANGGSGAASNNFYVRGGSPGRIAMFCPQLLVSEGQIDVMLGTPNSGSTYSRRTSLWEQPYRLGAALPLGGGCDSPALGTPELTSSRPYLGELLDLALTAPGLGFAFLLVGNQVVLPVNVGAPMAATCNLLHSVDMILPMPVLGGTGTLSFVLPPSTLLEGTSLCMSAVAVQQTSSPPAEVALSNSLQLILGSAPIPSNASNPFPFDGWTGVDQGSWPGVSTSAILYWTPGLNAQSQDVYLGINPVLGSQDLYGSFSGIAESINPALLPATTYYWRVDTVSSAGIATGHVWTFTTP